MKEKRARLSETVGNRHLYLIATQGDRSLSAHLDHVGRLLAGGVTLVQMREKFRPAGELLILGEALKELCLRHQVPLVVNDDPELARHLQAAGVHLGQDDMAPQRARQIVGNEMLIGLSTHSLDQVREALADDCVDMLGLGPVFYSSTKDVKQPLGCGMLQEVLSIGPSKPIWAIGGIGPAQAEELRAVGWHRAALSAALMNAEQPEEAARHMAGLLS